MSLRAIIADKGQQIHDDASTETVKEVVSFLRSPDLAELVSSILAEIAH